MGLSVLVEQIQNVELKKLLSTVIIALLVSGYLVVYLLSHTPRLPFKEELEFQTIDGESVVKENLPSVSEQGDDDILLSVVVPSYNETKRILIMLRDAISYLQVRMPRRWEIVIVDDGSKDGTSDYCLKLSREVFRLEKGQLRVVKFTKNRGKGGAVRQGLLHIRGRYGLFADADGASKFSDVDRLLTSIEKLEGSKLQAAVAIGSRAHMVNTDAVVERSFIRNLLMYGLHTLVFVFGVRSINDTQCGFKLFNRQAINAIFPYLHTEGWIFDVEILMLALRKRIPIAEVPISWHEVDGSKMDLARDSINMAKDLVVIRMAYILHIYKDDKEC
ncbi:BN860_04984g1_1 [Zygosaccharomyces bailii CLIB 213]|uniref:dolichyl-phosphate beta-glucosyltransferase n=1 Tax=Zygosaccharomyces bailii (strain CLIB 213 / ATCC 58445 / CBS 680 / BCRC 21525 / NBRC 1098 / NCYC 1416 / NRRL Y-2227) TaxID=1333698 RepID=A0A8J2T3K5_ZYGB2|nr:BN860_04984g1_1 [Zygosaccharomyces bailii CLIB 213]